MNTPEVVYETYKKKALIIVLMMIMVGLIDTRLYPLLYIPIISIVIKNRRNCSSHSFDDKLNIADIGIILISLYEVVSVFLPGHLGINTQIESIQRILYVCFFWFLFRIIITDTKQITYIINFISIVTGILSLLTIAYYLKHKSMVYSLGIDDMISFRALYHPLGFISNDWVAILLCLLPMPVASIINATTKKATIVYSLTYYLVIISILISFSRGAYLALLFFIITQTILFCVYKSNYPRKVCIITAFVFLFACVSIYPDKNSVISTCQMSKTTVQKQSIQGRISKWDESISLYKQSPVFGVGSGNYGILYDFLAKDKRSTITRRSTNSYLQLLIEKGVVGTMVMVIAIILIMLQCYRSVRIDKCKIPFLLAVCALFFREFVFSSFFEERRMPLLCVLLLLLIIQNPVSNEY